MQKEYFGNNSIENLEKILNENQVERIFLVTGGESFFQSGAAGQIDRFLSTMETYRHFGFQENPKFEELIEGTRLLNRFNPDIIIAVGGGSVIDTAKILSILTDEYEQAKEMVRGEKMVPQKKAPLICIPTTSGSGSEATHFAVAYVENKKYSISEDFLLPEYSIVDPVLTYSLTQYQTAVSGMDAFCQAIESFWSKGATKKSKAYALEAIKIIFGNLEAVVKNPSPSLRSALAEGSNLAGKAINITKTTAPHALSYGLTLKYNIPHGHAVGITLGKFFELNLRLAIESNDTDLAKRMNELIKLLGCNSAYEASKIFYKTMNKIGLSHNLSSIGLKSENELHQLVEGVNEERLDNHPVLITKDLIFEILKTSI